MIWSSLFLVFSLIAFTSCSGQEKGNPLQPPATTPPPTIIRNFEAVPMDPDFDTTLVSQYFRSIFQDSKGNLWFGTIGEGVVRYDGQSLTYYSNPDGFVNTTVYAITEDHDGNLWFGTDQGVYKYDGTTFRNYHQADGLRHVDISRKGILVDQLGTIWVGTHGGVYRYDPAGDDTGGQSFSLFQQLPPINVAGIMEDKNGNIWFASAKNGVFRYDGSTINVRFGVKCLNFSHL